MRARLGARRGGELRPHRLQDHGARPIVPRRVVRRMALILKHANKNCVRAALSHECGLLFSASQFDVVNHAGVVHLFMTPHLEICERMRRA